MSKIHSSVIIQSIREAKDPEWLHLLTDHPDPIIVYHVSRNPNSRPDTLAKASSIVSKAPVGWTAHRSGLDNMYVGDSIATLNFCHHNVSKEDLSKHLDLEGLTDKVQCSEDPETGESGMSRINFFNSDDAFAAGRSLARILPPACESCGLFGASHNITVHLGQVESDEDSGRRTVNWNQTPIDIDPDR